MLYKGCYYTGKRRNKRRTEGEGERESVVERGEKRVSKQVFIDYGMIVPIKILDPNVPIHAQNFLFKLLLFS